MRTVQYTAAMLPAFFESVLQLIVRTSTDLPPDVRAAYTQKYGPLVDDGVASLQQATKINPEYDDAMTYLNLLYRRKADMVESTAEREALTKQADDLLDKVKEIKQKRAEQAEQKPAS